MNIPRPVRLSLLLASTLGILAACDVSDSPARTNAPTTATFSPRILAPAGGVRKAEWLHLQVWTRDDNGDGTWDSLYSDAKIPPASPSLKVTVPVGKRVRYRVAGYVISFPSPGKRQADTVWSAENEVRIYSAGTTDDDAGTVAKNWAVAPVSPFSESTLLTAGSPIVLTTRTGQRLAVGTSDSVSCGGTTPADSIVSLVPQFATTYSVWVRSCSEDAEVLPSSPRRLQWAVDTIGVAKRLTPSAPKPSSGFVDFSDFSRISELELNPEQSIDFGEAKTTSLAWNLALSQDTSTPDTGDYPSAPASRDAAQFDTVGSKLNFWQELHDTLDSYKTGMRVLVTLVRTDISLGKEWVSAPTRFWFTLVPPPLPSRFNVVATRWDSVQVDWSLRDDLEYRAFRHPGRTTFDPSVGQPLDDSVLKKGVFGIGALPSDSAVTILLVVRNPLTGLSSTATAFAITRPLPALPVPTMSSPSAANPVTLKQSQQNATTVEVATDSAGKRLSILYRATLEDTSGITNPLTQPWPIVTLSNAVTSQDGLIQTNGAPGQYVFLSIVATDGEGRISAPLKRVFMIVADNEVVAPSPPSGLSLTQRDSNALTFSWKAMPGFDYRLRYSINGQVPKTEAVSSNTLIITGLKPGDFLSSIAVQAVDQTNSTLVSPFSQEIPTAYTKSPPPVPEIRDTSWFVRDHSLFLKLVWVRAPGTTNEYRRETVTSQTPPTAAGNWLPWSRSAPGLDSVEIPYSELQDSRFVAFGIRAHQDSLTSDPAWMVVPIPRLPPAFDTGAIAWQNGDIVKISFAVTAQDTALFQLKAHITQDGRTTTQVVTSNPGIFRLGSPRTSVLSAEFFWERKAPTGVGALDIGTPVRIEKKIIPAPKEFVLLPGLSTKEWRFPTPSGLDAKATSLLVQKTRSGDVSAIPFKAGTVGNVKSDPLDQDSFWVAQIVDRDTSLVSLPRTLTLLPVQPVASPAPGSYLFPFDITLTVPEGIKATAQVEQPGGKWETDVPGPFNPFVMSSPTARLAGPFEVSDTMSLAYTLDSTFNDKVWAERVTKLKETGWIIPTNTSVTYVNRITTTVADAHLKIVGPPTSNSAIVDFAVDPINNSMMNLSEAKEIRVHYLGGTLTGQLTIVVTCVLDDSVYSISLKSTTFDEGMKLSTAVLKPTSTKDFAPSYWNKAKESMIPIPWEEFPKYLKNVRSVGITVRPSATGSAGSVSLTGLTVDNGRGN